MGCLAANADKDIAEAAVAVEEERTWQVGFGVQSVECDFVAKEWASEKTNTVGSPQARRSEANVRPAAAEKLRGSEVYFQAQQKDVLSMEGTVGWDVRLPGSETDSAERDTGQRRNAKASAVEWHLCY